MCKFWHQKEVSLKGFQTSVNDAGKLSQIFWVFYLKQNTKAPDFSVLLKKI